MLIHGWVIRVPVLNVVRNTAGVLEARKLESRCLGSVPNIPRIRAEREPSEKDRSRDNHTAKCYGLSAHLSPGKIRALRFPLKPLRSAQVSCGGAKPGTARDTSKEPVSCRASKVATPQDRQRLRGQAPAARRRLRRIPKRWEAFQIRPPSSSS